MSLRGARSHVRLLDSGKLVRSDHGRRTKMSKASDNMHVYRSVWPRKKIGQRLEKRKERGRPLHPYPPAEVAES